MKISQLKFRSVIFKTIILGFMFTSDYKDDIDMQRQLKKFYTRSNTILHQFVECDESVKL